MMSWSSDNTYKHDDYWRLRDYGQMPRLIKDLKSELSKRHYNPPERMSRAYAIECLQRSDRGLMSYHGLSDEELRGLFQARGMSLPSTLTDKRYNPMLELVSALDRADDNPRFRRFTDLPPELRNRIYEYYFADFVQPIYAPSQPPLTLACQLLRQESLGMFYSTATFILSLVIKPNPDLLRLQLPDQLALWVLNTRAPHLALIQNLTIRIGKPKPPPTPYEKHRCGRYDGYVSPRESFFDIDIKISFEGPQFSVTATPELLSSKHKAIDRVRKSIRRIVAREGKHRFRRHDIYDLRLALERGLNP